MERKTIDCSGCGRHIHLERVLPPRDDTQPWDTWSPAGHEVVHVELGRLVVKCGPDRIRELKISQTSGAQHYAPTTCRPCLESLAEPEEPAVEQVTWIEHWNRLSEEWFDIERRTLELEYADEIAAYEAAQKHRHSDPILGQLWGYVKTTAVVVTSLGVMGGVMWETFCVLAHVFVWLLSFSA
jgi:hypothetical protein